MTLTVSPNVEVTERSSTGLQNSRRWIGEADHYDLREIDGDVMTSVGVW